MQTKWKHAILLRMRVYALQSSRATDADNKQRDVRQNEGKEVLDTWFGKYQKKHQKQKQKNCPGQLAAAWTLFFCCCCFFVFLISSSMPLFPILDTEDKNYSKVWRKSLSEM